MGNVSAATRKNREVRGLFVLASIMFGLAWYFWTPSRGDSIEARVMLAALFGIPGCGLVVLGCRDAWKHFRPLDPPFETDGSSRQARLSRSC